MSEAAELFMYRAGGEAWAGSGGRDRCPALHEASVVVYGADACRGIPDLLD